MNGQLRIADLMRRLPELRDLDRRLSDPSWMPSAQEIARASAALALSRAEKQRDLPLRQS